MVEVGTLVILPEVALQYDWSKQVHVETKLGVYLLADQPCLHTGRGWHSGLTTKVLGHHTSLWRGDDVYVCVYVCMCVCNSNGEDCAP